RTATPPLFPREIVVIAKSSQSAETRDSDDRHNVALGGIWKRYADLRNILCQQSCRVCVYRAEPVYISALKDQIGLGCVSELSRVGFAGRVRVHGVHEWKA